MEGPEKDPYIVNFWQRHQDNPMGNGKFFKIRLEQLDKHMENNDYQPLPYIIHKN